MRVKQTGLLQLNGSRGQVETETRGPTQTGRFSGWNYRAGLVGTGTGLRLQVSKLQTNFFFFFKYNSQLTC